MPLSFFVRTGRRGCRKRKRQKYNSREKVEKVSSERRRQVRCFEMKWLREVGRPGERRWRKVALAVSHRLRGCPQLCLRKNTGTEQAFLSFKFEAN